MRGGLLCALFVSSGFRMLEMTKIVRVVYVIVTSEWAFTWMVSDYLVGSVVTGCLVQWLSDVMS